MYYVYILQSDKDGKFYIGYTNNLKQRVDRHNKGRVESTAPRRPFHLVHYEVFINQRDAINKEKFLKSGYGRRYLRKNLNNYLNSQPAQTLPL